MSTGALTLQRDGAQKIACALSNDDLQTLRCIADETTTTRPGARLRARDPQLAAILGPGNVGGLVTAMTGCIGRPVRVLAFDKNERLNWALAWHQDRTIAVQEHRDVDGFGPWTVKQGLPHVAPPVSILERMFTARLHLDDCGPDNAPLKIAIGSHTRGLIPVPDTASVVGNCMTYECFAEAGDIWLYKTLILHSSDAAAAPARRRVIQVDYADFELPNGLAWLE